MPTETKPVKTWEVFFRSYRSEVWIEIKSVGPVQRRDIRYLRSLCDFWLEHADDLLAPTPPKAPLPMKCHCGMHALTDGPVGDHFGLHHCAVNKVGGAELMVARGLLQKLQSADHMEALEASLSGYLREAFNEVSALMRPASRRETAAWRCPT